MLLRNATRGCYCCCTSGSRGCGSCVCRGSRGGRRQDALNRFKLNSGVVEVKDDGVREFSEEILNIIFLKKGFDL